MSGAEQGGRAWVFGDNIDTDVLAPGLYMRGPIEELARHCLEAVDPAFAENVAPGDYVVAGSNFGLGSSREQAAYALRHLGVAAIVAPSFAGIFYRNAFNLGLPAVICMGAAGIAAGDRLSLDLDTGRLVDHTQDRTLECEPVPPNLKAMIDAGGLVPLLERRFAEQRNGRMK